MGWIVDLFIAEQLGKIARHNNWDRDFPKPIHRLKLGPVKKRKK